MSNLLVGADPELFLADSQSGKIVSAIGLLGGTKEHPVPIRELGKGYAIQEDNVLAEYNIPACTGAGSFGKAHNLMQEYLQNKVGKLGLKLKISASEIMPEEELTDPRASVFGCDPDFNVWSLEPNPKPWADDPRLRSAGGHVHVGFKMTKAEKVQLGRTLDLYLGLWSVLKDPDTRRRQLYGKAGSIRFKPYGIEYRTLSNFWINGLYTEVWNRVQAALSHIHKGGHDVTKYGGDIQKAINESDKALALSLLQNYGIKA